LALDGAHTRVGKADDPTVPEICRFSGVIVQMFYADHEPPHFHAVCEGRRVAVTINVARIVGDPLPPRTARMLRELVLARRPELRENWRRARAGEPLMKIAPPDGAR